MNNILYIGLIVIACLAVLGLGIKVIVTMKGSTNTTTNKLKKVKIDGSYTGRDNNK
ncbi:hypothetical protein [Photobacterium phosphoreum]|uniref:hypothetical protein n=1 Tax=Photobacterium phosphoreum TaxID=659 RepID=UPI000ACEA9CE|nr:hypothetical protein [Photobacterium phosphoreum]